MDASRGFEVELHPVAGAGRSTDRRVFGDPARRPVVAWLLVLACVAGVAGVGRVVSPAGDAGARSAVAVGILAGPLPVLDAPAASPVAPMPDLIVLSSPATPNALITTRELTIRGFLPTGTGTIRVTLEARGNRIIDEATIEAAPALGEWPGAGRHRQFETRFGLPNPRPNGRMIVQVALLDEDGRIVDVIRRPIRVGALLETAGA